MVPRLRVTVTWLAPRAASQRVVVAAAAMVTMFATLAEAVVVMKSTALVLGLRRMTVMLLQPRQRHRRMAMAMRSRQIARLNAVYFNLAVVCVVTG